MQRLWNLGPGLKLLVSGETASVDANTLDTSRSATTVALTYSNSDGFSGITRNQFRLDSGTQHNRQFVTFNQIDWRLSPDYTLYAKFRYSKTEDRDTDELKAKIEERSLGFAYRPVKNDRLNLLAKYTRLLDLAPLRPGETTLSGRVLDVLSAELILDLTPDLQWVMKGVAQLEEDRSAGLAPTETRTYLAIQRLNVNVWRRIDLGLEYRLRTQKESDDSRQGWLSEAMWNLHKNFRVGAGYNFTDFSDDEFSRNDYSAGGWFIRLQGKY